MRCAMFTFGIETLRRPSAYNNSNIHAFSMLPDIPFVTMGVVICRSSQEWSARPMHRVLLVSTVDR
jgi:hypothetical protein